MRISFPTKVPEGVHVIPRPNLPRPNLPRPNFPGPNLPRPNFPKIRDKSASVRRVCSTAVSLGIRQRRGRRRDDGGEAHEEGPNKPGLLRGAHVAPRGRPVSAHGASHARAPRAKKLRSDPVRFCGQKIICNESIGPKNKPIVRQLSPIGIRQRRGRRRGDGGEAHEEGPNKPGLLRGAHVAPRGRPVSAHGASHARAPRAKKLRFRPACGSTTSTGRTPASWRRRAPISC